MNTKFKLIITALMLVPLVVIIIVGAVIPSRLPPIVYVVVGIFSAIDLLIVYMFLWRTPKQAKYFSNSASYSDGILYSDRLIYIDDNGLTIRLFYFPFGSKRVNFSDIAVVQAFKGGCMRIWGSDNLRTWFGLDWGRMYRSMTFVIKRKNAWSRIGFTAKDSERVVSILRSRNLLEIRE